MNLFRREIQFQFNFKRTYGNGDEVSGKCSPRGMFHFFWLISGAAYHFFRVPFNF